MSNPSKMPAPGEGRASYSNTADCTPHAYESQAKETVRQDEFSDPRIVRMLRQVSEDAPSKLGVFWRVYSGTATSRMAIKAKCLECCWMDVAGIRECGATGCPLWEFRPHQKKRVTSEATLEGGVE
jgi:hypothetical protein